METYVHESEGDTSLTSGEKGNRPVPGTSSQLLDPGHPVTLVQLQLSKDDER